MKSGQPHPLTPHFGFDWYRFELTAPGRSHRFRDQAEANAYLSRLNKPPAEPGPNPELQAMADEAAALLRLRSDFNWKKKKNPEPEPVMPRFDDSEEFPF